MLKAISVKEALPSQNETVWFFSKKGRGMLALCMVNPRNGWHLGWHSGSRWHSYSDPKISEDDSTVTHWSAVEIPSNPVS